ncbi:MAG: hypothetical protein DRP62_08330 [Planctomycetota bacterium]|nr:MAG: hypothetical protein DRP62_08330 [Planctomycetota bacterium]
MGDFDNSNTSANQESDEPIRLDEDTDKPIPFDGEDTSNTKISHSPLSLGGDDTATAPRPVTKKPTEKMVSSPDRITGVKTFFTKLHAGAIDFLNEQINNWLRDNPGITIKRTDIVTGDVVGKKIEPNLIITVWY